MKYLLLSLTILLTISAFVPTSVVIAQEPGLWQLSQCSGTDCSACNVVHLANGAIKWVIGILFILAAGLIAVAGIRLVTSAGNQSSLDSAKDMFTNAIIGFVIVLSAWLIVDTIMRALVGDKDSSSRDGSLSITTGGRVTGWLFWSDVQCQVIDRPKYDPDKITLEYDKAIEELEQYDNGATISEAGIPAPSGTAPISTKPAVISGNLVTYKGAKFDSGIVGKVDYVSTTFGLRVSGGHRTAARNKAVGGVANSNHLTGRAADFVGTQAQMTAARQWARNNGATETLIHNAGSGTHLHLAW